jgi:hypothetical protein
MAPPSLWRTGRDVNAREVVAGDDSSGMAARLCQAKCERVRHFVEPGAVAMEKGLWEGGQVVPGKV